MSLRSSSLLQCIVAMRRITSLCVTLCFCTLQSALSGIPCMRRMACCRMAWVLRALLSVRKLGCRPDSILSICMAWCCRHRAFCLEGKNDYPPHFCWELAVEEFEECLLLLYYVGLIEFWASEVYYYWQASHLGVGVPFWNQGRSRSCRLCWWDSLLWSVFFWPKHIFKLQLRVCLALPSLCLCLLALWGIGLS